MAQFVPGRAPIAVAPARISHRPSTKSPGVPRTVTSALQGSGRPLTPQEQSLAHSRFGHHFGDVRILDNDAAARAADDIDANAFTFGSKIAFAPGRYRPDTPEGRTLLTHELMHVVQQPRTMAFPVGIANSASPAEVQARSMSQSAPVSAPPGLIHRQPKTDPGNTPPTPGTSKPPQPRSDTPKEPPAANKDLRTRVREWLDKEDFHLPLVPDKHDANPEQWHAMYTDQRYTLAKITDDTWKVLNQTSPGTKRGDVWSQVYQYYQDKEKALESSSWQWVVQTLYTPSYTLLSSQPITGSRFQKPLQLTLGGTLAQHPQGYSGLEHQFTVTGSFFNLRSGNTDWFQNALAQYQISAVTPIGHDFRLGSTWSYEQASIYAQLAAGVGANWDTSAGGERKAYVGFLFQAGLGGQFTVNIGWFQLMVQGTLVYSYFSKTAQPASKPTSTLGLQPGIGIGGQF